MEFLACAYECIVTGSVGRLQTLMGENASTPVPPQAFEAFTQWFAAEEKGWLKGSVNIHGMGGSGIPKVNLTSIACLYLSVITHLPIAKTGSRKNTGVMGSTDFFEELGLTRISEKKRMLEEFGFVYFDYLSLSPWKAYKPLLRQNGDIAEILDQYHFFEYEIGTLGLGVSSQTLYKQFLNQIKFPAPLRCFTFSSEMDGKTFDEVVDPAQSSFCTEPLTRQQISKMNHDLVFGLAQESFWLGALRESVALFAVKLEVAASLAEGREMFDHAYAEKRVAHKLSQIHKTLSERA